MAEEEKESTTVPLVSDIQRSLSLKSYNYLGQGNEELKGLDPKTVTRRLSNGDHPRHLSETENENFLLGQRDHVLVTEFVPSHCSLKDQSAEPSGWKLPLEIFSSKKQSNVRQKSRRVRSYYEAQDKLIDAYELLERGIEQEITLVDTDVYYKQGLFYSRVTLLVNVLLLIAKLVAGVLSGSMSVISSVVDSSLDLFSGIILWWASKAVKSRSLYLYPQGRTKIEPVAIIILSVIMALASLQIIRESVGKIVELANRSVGLPDVDIITFCVMGLTIIIKLILFLVCRRINSHIVRALALDHRNDVVSNSVAILCGYIGSSDFRSSSGIYGFSYVDPLGAILISIYIIYNWWKTGSEQIKMLTGHTARPDFISKLTWVALNHHPEVQQVDTVRAFHFGSNFLVEVDIVLPSDMILREAHDIGESLQKRLETLSEVERAFVHLDYEFTHHPHSEHKVV